MVNITFFALQLKTSMVSLVQSLNIELTLRSAVKKRTGKYFLNNADKTLRCILGVVRSYLAIKLL